MTFVVVSSHFGEDLCWLKKCPWKVIVISHKGFHPQKCIQPTQVIPNKGREASSYLKYIVDNYDRLPDHVMFIHGHEHAWHQYHKKSLFDVVHLGDYFPLNSFWTNTDEHKEKIKKHWHVIEPWVGPQPDELGFLDGSAQFIVSKERIRRHPKEVYKTWYHTIMTSPDDFELAVVFEYTWHYIFGEPWRLAPFTIRT